MVPKRLRLPREGFRAPKTAKRAVSSHISLVFYPSEPKLSGVAVVLPKKAVPQAVDRHKAKRRLLSLMRSWKVPGMAVIAYGRHGIDSLPFKELKEELDSLYARLPAR